MDHDQTSDLVCTVYRLELFDCFSGCQVLSVDNLGKQFGPQIRPDKMSGLIWIQTV